MTVRDIIPWRKKDTSEVLAPKHAYEDTFMGLQREMNRLFDSFFNNFGISPAPSPLPGFTPRVDVNETDTAIEVTAELPGLTDKDMEVTLCDNELVLRGEKKMEKEEDRGGVHRVERSFGSFYRRIPLPREVVEDKVNAEFKNGVLHVSIPKAETEKTRSIKIKVS